MTQDEATESIVRLMRFALENHQDGEDFDSSTFLELVRDESVTRDDFALMVRLMMSTLLGLAHKCESASGHKPTLTTHRLTDFNGQPAWLDIRWS